MSEKLSERFKKYWEFGLTTSRANIYRQEFDQIIAILRAHEDGWFETQPLAPPAPAQPPMPASRRVLEKYLHGGPAEADPDEFDV